MNNIALGAIAGYLAGRGALGSANPRLPGEAVYDPNIFLSPDPPAYVSTPAEGLELFKPLPFDPEDHIHGGESFPPQPPRIPWLGPIVDQSDPDEREIARLTEWLRGIHGPLTPEWRARIKRQIEAIRARMRAAGLKGLGISPREALRRGRKDPHPSSPEADARRWRKARTLPGGGSVRHDRATGKYHWYGPQPDADIHYGPDGESYITILEPEKYGESDSPWRDPRNRFISTTGDPELFNLKGLGEDHPGSGYRDGGLNPDVKKLLKTGLLVGAGFLAFKALSKK